MNYAFHPEAEAELNAGIDWYESRERGLGLDFATEVEAAVQRALSFPHAWPVMLGDIRRALVHRFPYGVLYAQEPLRVFVIAVMHLRRHPSYWHDRMA